jgi:putative transposase
MTIHRKDTRLPPENYIGSAIYFVTICSAMRRAYLAEREVAERILTVLRECAAKQSFLLHAWCVMPDHFHVLAEGTESGSDLREFVRVFKLRTAFEFRQSHHKRLWEMSYYDHILRSADAVEDAACYIWWNPVRKQLCLLPHEFPFSGSQTIPWMQRASQGSPWTPPWSRTNHKSSI